MISIFLYAIISVLIVSIISFIGLFTLSIKTDRLKRFLIYMVSFSAGALFGDAFIHLLPELIEEYGLTTWLSLTILGGVIIFFILEKIILWNHCHIPITKDHVHPFAIMNLVGDGLHNFIDGMIIGVSYLISIPAGIATTIAVGLHEIPQEIGDYGVLIHGGFSRMKALTLNFLIALVAVLGTVSAFVLNNYLGNIQPFLIAIAIGGFIYIAGSDLIPELHKESKIKKSILQLICFIIGIIVMLLLIFLES